MALNKTQLENLILANLADNSDILPIKHREVENEIINYVYSRLPRNVGWYGPMDIADTRPVGYNYPTGGNVVTAIKQNSGQNNNDCILVTLSIPMDNTNYKVNISIQSMGNSGLDNDVFQPVFKILNSTQFQVWIMESGNALQSIKYHFDVIQLQ